ncbi:protein piccolo-like [Panulirus ornatus]|uniref:protein piccolo-like n=1 Tax=Panulirus ornatus TaxID=150431 RepID=UPI003A866C04
MRKDNILFLYQPTLARRHLHKGSKKQGSNRDHFNEGFASPLEPEPTDPYRSSYGSDYPAHPALGHSPRGSVSPPCNQYNTPVIEGRPSRTASPPTHQYNSPAHLTEDRTPNQDYNSTEHPQEGLNPMYPSSSPPPHHYNTSPAHHHTGGGSPRRCPSTPTGQDNTSPNHYHDARPPRRTRASGPRHSKVKRFLLTRDPKDRRISGNGLGMKVVGGKDIPGTRGRLGAYIARLHPGGVAAALGQLKEGDLLLEWNGISLVDRTYEEVQAVVAQSVDDLEVEIVVRSDINMITGEHMTSGSSRDRGGGQRGTTPPDTNHSYQFSRRRSDPSKDNPLDINGNRSNSDAPVVYMTYSSSQEDMYINEDQYGEGQEESAPVRGTQQTESPRARSVSKPRLHNSPVRERSSNRDLQRLSEEDLAGETSTSRRRSSSPGRRSPNDAPVSTGGGSHTVTEESKANTGTADAGTRTPHHNTRGHRRRHHQKNNAKGSGGGTSRRSSDQQMGEVQLQVCYDSRACILYVTVLRARSLYTVRDDGDSRPDPFIKVYLLPGRSVENQRRTRYFSRTSCPDWNQTMVYPNLQPTDLAKRHLEVTAWNYQADKPNEFLGEVVLDLSDSSVMDEEPRWYKLQELDREDLAEQQPGTAECVTQEPTPFYTKSQYI